jgi:protein tyrosine/serine phosphatase
LVHCSAGVQRTGGAVALFRMIEQGWTPEAALAEMRTRGNDGNDMQRNQLLTLHRRLTTDVAATAEPTLKR